jgi:hypothetical protein
LAELLASIEMSALGHLMRGAGVWAYAVVNLAHIIGVATLFGAVLVLDLRLLGAWRRFPLISLTTPLVPVASVGFALAIVSGVCLLAANATEYIGNPFLLVKFPAIALGVINVMALTASRAWRHRATLAPHAPLPRSFAVAGAISLTTWLTAIAAGRMIGYW